MDLKDCQEIACAADVQTFEACLVRFANDLGFGLMTGALISEKVDGPARSLPFGNTPDAYKPISESIKRGKRDPVMHRLKRLLVPFVYDQSMYVDEKAADLWEVQAQYGFKTGIAMRIDADGERRFLIGVDREQPLPNDSSRLTRMTADLHLFAVHAQVAALRLFEPPEPRSDQVPKLTVRELEILKWTAAGKSAWAVGQILGTSEHTVNYHLRRVMTTLAVASKYQAAAKALSVGLI